LLLSSRCAAGLGLGPTGAADGVVLLQRLCDVGASGGAAMTLAVALRLQLAGGGSAADDVDGAASAAVGLEFFIRGVRAAPTLLSASVVEVWRTLRWSDGWLVVVAGLGGRGDAGSGDGEASQLLHSA
jgi:hypothetical protein